MHWFTDVWVQIWDYKGRSSRQALAMWMLWNLPIAVSAFLIDVAMGNDLLRDGIGIAVAIYSIAVALPNTALNVRRLHDFGASGWWLLVLLLPFGVLIHLVLLFVPGEAAENRFGPSPDKTCEEPTSPA